MWLVAKSLAAAFECSASHIVGLLGILPGAGSWQRIYMCIVAIRTRGGRPEYFIPLLTRAPSNSPQDAPGGQRSNGGHMSPKLYSRRVAVENETVRDSTLCTRLPLPPHFLPPTSLDIALLSFLELLYGATGGFVRRQKYVLHSPTRDGKKKQFAVVSLFTLFEV